MLEHAAEQKQVLIEEHLWDYLSAEEVNKLYNTQTDFEVDSFARYLRDKYYDQMLDDFDKKNNLEANENENVLDSDLSKTSKNALLRAQLHDIEEFLDYVMENGWNSIRGFGIKSATETFRWAFPDEDEDSIQEYVDKYKIIKKDED